MKKWESVIAGILLIITLLALAALIACAVVEAKNAKNDTVYLTNGDYYALTTKVVEIDREADIVTCEDYNGNLWKFYGVEDWEVNDCASLLMDSNGTKKIYDDVVKGARYSAWELEKN